MAGSSIVYVGIAPHPPIMVPEVGGSAIDEVRASIDAMQKITERIVESGAETIVLVSPHAPLEARAFVAYQGATLTGSFANFRAPQAEVVAALDEELLSDLTRIALSEGYRIVPINGNDLDHGTTVPLYFLFRYGWRGKVVCLGYTFLSNNDHLRFGSCIRAAADLKDKPIAVIASGDLSHRLKIDAPAGYNPDAHFFDDAVVAAIKTSTLECVVTMDPDLRKKAGECGYRSMLVAIGASGGLTQNCEVLSYEAPFGVGYMVAQLLRDKGKGLQTDTSKASSVLIDEDYPALARLAVETFIRDGHQIKPSSKSTPVRAACFVTIKTKAGDLRGCVGTIEPVSDSLEEELIANAINAATRDPRFPPLTPTELINLRYSVDVLSGLEPAAFEQLDPKLFGVVVEEVDGPRRGVLLPDIAGVKSVEEQVTIAMRKAGIAHDSRINLLRFRVARFRESTKD